ncbi:MAG TPA: DUF5057 domain-containing protein [Clostridia bacterium]|nr:DUF5057 domain-containing protein [Clostridia bacterium]
MYKKIYKPISLVLTVMLLVMMLPASAFAASLAYPSDTFIESETNDGSIGTEITLTISGNTFVTGLDSSDITANNVPSGLQVAVTRLSSTKAKISLTGKAKYHMSSNNTDNLEITFKRSSFSYYSIFMGGLTNYFKVRFKDNQTSRMICEQLVFTEAPVNDGTFPESKYIYLESAKFNNTVFKEGTHYTTSNVPAGLTLSVVRVSDSLARIELKGKASGSNAAGFVSGVGISFRDAAFAVGTMASSVAQSFMSDIKLQFIDSRPISVLEVYPNGISSSDNTGIKDLATALGSDQRFDITSMSMNRFISLRDEINGNYDAIYFGKGRYVRNGVNENRYGNDITDLLAFGKDGKGGIAGTGGFVDAGLPFLYHDSALKQDSIDTGAGVRTEMYKMLQLPKIKDKVKPGTAASNVIAVTDSNKSGIFSNLAKTVEANNRRPILVMAEQPVSYLKINQVDVGRNLTFTFLVADTDSPLDAKLTTKLYIDKDRDSLFEENEMVGSRDTVNGQYETINYTMPSDSAGVYFWKLVTTDAKGAKAEVRDVFRLKGQEMRVKVLQISPDGNQFHLAAEFDKAVPGGMPGEKYGYRSGEYKIDVTEMSVSDFNTNASRAGFTLNGNYNMVVLGFHDNYSQDREFSSDAVKALQSFIETKQSVMFTHDSIHFLYNLNLTKAFKDDVGQAGGFTAGLAGYEGVISRPSVLTDTIRNTYNLGTNSHGDIYQSVQPYPKTAKLVSPVNSSTVTIYPYNLTTLPQSERKVADTHYQWFKLDLEDPSVIPLFNLYGDDSGERVNDDAMNNYYTYTKGNITYSGTGHSGNYPYPDYELRLFVNTAIKAYNIANQRPVINVTEPDPDSDFKINKDEDTVQLKFTVSDFEDTAVKYMIEADWDNNGTFETVLREKTSAVSGEQVAEAVKNKASTTTEDYKIRIRAWDSQSPTPAEAEPVTLNITNEDGVVISSSVSFTDMSGNEISSCLIGEKVNMVAKVTAKGRPVSQPPVQFDLDLKAAYTDDGKIAVDKSSKNAGSFTFSKTSDPQPSFITLAEELTVDPTASSNTDLKASATISYKIDGAAVSPQVQGSKLNVINGNIDIRVKDDQDKPVSNVTVKDADREIGTTGLGGSLTINRAAGEKQYLIDVPAGYELKEVKVYKYVNGDPGNKQLVSGDMANVTRGEYKWEMEYRIAYKANVGVSYFKIRNDTAVLLGGDNTGEPYTLASQVNAPAKYAAVVSIGAIGTENLTGSSLNVTGVAFTIETKDKNGDVTTKSSLCAVVSDKETTLTGSAILVGAEQLLYGLNTTPPVSGTYANGKYYVIISVEKAEGQTVQIKEITLYMSNGSKNLIKLNGRIKFVTPSTPLMR